ncbi:response regulator transcription factor [Solwaraspora sp. WMMA2080]|uniref:helix-turn-helix transcriptional regulator n=1 Tax=Solwaraspora sp. WMMA2080 TaxID=3015165 RepID=UPI0032B1A453
MPPASPAPPPPCWTGWPGKPPGSTANRTRPPPGHPTPPYRRWSTGCGGSPPTGPRTTAPDPPPPPDGTPAAAFPPPAAATVTAWTAGDPRQFAHAADTWRDVAVREQVRCLLAHGLHEPDPAQAVPALLAAESLADHAGLVVLLGRVRRALRRHAVRRDERGPRSGDLLTVRERDVLRLVAQGEPTRRIANQLGISTETVETHVRAGMRKLGARTRTEAAALAMEPDR